MRGHTQGSAKGRRWQRIIGQFVVIHVKKNVYRGKCVYLQPHIE